MADYYSSLHSGAEIDAGIAGGLRAVRTDAQSLTEGQKAQARRNIGAGEGTGGVIASATEPTDPAVSVWINTSGDTPVLYVRNTAGVWYPVPGLVGPPGPATGVNPNLLDNWFFGNPVNQRGQTSYSGAVYGADRWKTNFSGDTVSLTSGSITNTNNSASGGWHFHQILRDNISSLTGREVTASFLISEYSNNYIRPIVSFRNDSSEITAITGGTTMKPGVIEMTGVVPAGTTEIRVGFYAYSGVKSGDYVSIAAAKLELGSVQTLAHQDSSGNWLLNEIPDYGAQLARCQRYFVKYKSIIAEGFLTSSALNYHMSTKTPVPMRAVPAAKMESYIARKYNGYTAHTGANYTAPTALSVSSSYTAPEAGVVDIFDHIATAVDDNNILLSYVINGLELSADL